LLDGKCDDPLFSELKMKSQKKLEEIFRASLRYYPIKENKEQSIELKRRMRRILVGSTCRKKIR
jgi:hypothetical protein